MFRGCALGIGQAGHRDVCAIIMPVGVYTRDSVSLCVDPVGVGVFLMSPAAGAGSDFVSLEFIASARRHLSLLLSFSHAFVCSLRKHSLGAFCVSNLKPDTKGWAAVGAVEGWDGRLNLCDVGSDCAGEKGVVTEAGDFVPTVRELLSENINAPSHPEWKPDLCYTHPPRAQRRSKEKADGAESRQNTLYQWLFPLPLHIVTTVLGKEDREPQCGRQKPKGRVC